MLKSEQAGRSAGKAIILDAFGYLWGAKSMPRRLWNWFCESEPKLVGEGCSGTEVCPPLPFTAYGSPWPLPGHNCEGERNGISSLSQLAECSKLELCFYKNKVWIDGLHLCWCTAAWAGLWRLAEPSSSLGQGELPLQALGFHGGWTHCAWRLSHI
jgi:hypothetical protein